MCYLWSETSPCIAGQTDKVAIKSPVNRPSVCSLPGARGKFKGSLKVHKVRGKEWYQLSEGPGHLWLYSWSPTTWLDDRSFNTRTVLPQECSPNVWHISSCVLMNVLYSVLKINSILSSRGLHRFINLEKKIFHKYIHCLFKKNNQIQIRAATITYFLYW